MVCFIVWSHKQQATPVCFKNLREMYITIISNFPQIEYKYFSLGTCQYNYTLFSRT